MKFIGKTLAFACLLVCALGGPSAHAVVTASLDRDRVTMGDTLRLTIAATENEAINNTDLRPLLADFEILQRSSSNNTSIINGRRSNSRQLLIDITPRRDGTLKIPPMRVGQHATNMLLVSVSPAPAGDTRGQNLLFEAELDLDSVYVQGQVILTLRVQQAINLESRSITDLQLDNAFVKALEQKSFQRTMDGRPWLVHEVRYAIFPEQSGTLEIPAQTFSARESKPRSGFFDLNSGGRQMRRSTQPLQINVLPRPSNFPSATWLPARNLRISESWSTPPEQLRAGESATRTIRIEGEGLQGAQLPPVLFPTTEGLKYYPDQPAISESETANGLLGVREDSAALVPTRAGSWTIPEVRIPWWDTQAGELRHAVLPQRVINVAAADPTTVSAVVPQTSNIAVEPGKTVMTIGSPASNTNKVWQIVAAATSTGWLLTIIYLLWTRGRRKVPKLPVSADDPSEARAFKKLSAACATNTTSYTRQALIEWVATLYPSAQVVSLSQVAELFKDPELAAELAALNTTLYSGADNQWQGAALAEILRGLRKQVKARGDDKQSELTLYPAAPA